MTRIKAIIADLVLVVCAVIFVLVLVVCAVIFTQHARLWLAQERARDAEAALTDCQQRGRFTLVADK